MIISSITHPAVIGTSILSATIFGSWFTFWNKTNLARTERERAYVCTLLSSSITSTSSLPLVYQLLTNGGDLSEILAYRTWTVLVTTFFMTFLFMDLTIGVVFYKNKIELLTGWIHHITYLGTLTWAIHNKYSSIFIMMCVLELPTFLLALGSVRSQLRRDYLFATAFLLTRILFHAFAIHSAWKLQPFGPIMNALSAFFPVHCFWFYGFIKQQIRLAKEKKDAKNLTQTSTTTTTTVTEKQNENQVQKVRQTTISKVTTLKKTLVSKTSQKKAVDYYITPTSSPSFHQQSPPVSVH